MTDSKSRILTVEDDQFMRKAIRLTLERSGYEVNEASDGRAALDMCAVSRFDLVLLDLDMPVMNGYDFITEFVKTDRMTPIVIFSSLNDVNDAMNVINMGAWDYIAKGHDGFSLIHKTVKRNIELAELRREKKTFENRLITEVEERTKELSFKNYELERLTETLIGEKAKSERIFEQFLLLLAAAIESKDHLTGGHVDRVGAYSRILAEGYGCRQEKIKEIYLGAMVHDIGKIGVSENILNKPTPLNDDEMDRIRAHTVEGYRLLMRIDNYHIPAVIAYCHHERWDGAGYPCGLSECQIPIEVRIVSIVDCWDALTSSRPYRKRAYTPEEALDIMESERGCAFDPELLDLFIDSEKESHVFEPDNALDGFELLLGEKHILQTVIGGRLR
jgi:response regulator RpfG family c-di-GMP phosphodiesterase